MRRGHATVAGGGSAAAGGSCARISQERAPRGIVAMKATNLPIFRDLSPRWRKWHDPRRAVFTQRVRGANNSVMNEAPGRDPRPAATRRMGRITRRDSAEVQALQKMLDCGECRRSQVQVRR